MSPQTDDDSGRHGDSITPSKAFRAGGITLDDRLERIEANGESLLKSFGEIKETLVKGNAKFDALEKEDAALALRVAKLEDVMAWVGRIIVGAVIVGLLDLLGFKG
jgi:hypothetical protein